jgi:RNA polymerase sigma-70 factor (ECF subfamily)
LTLTTELDALSDEALLGPFGERDEAAVRVLTTRYNRRLFRVARAILRDEVEAEDVVQETYVRALTSLQGFRGESSFSTWITRIAVNEALGRLRKRRPTVAWDEESEPVDLAAPASWRPVSPEQTMAHRELQDLVEASIDRLPDAFRAVFVARMVEGLSVDETAALFDIKPETVKTRVHRARARIRQDLQARVGSTIENAFAFDGARCARLTNTVVTRICRENPEPGTLNRTLNPEPNPEPGTEP